MWRSPFTAARPDVSGRAAIGVTIEDLEDRCSHCGSTAFKPFGAGTVKVLELLSQELEGLRLLRFDRDSTGGGMAIDAYWTVLLPEKPTS